MLWAFCIYFEEESFSDHAVWEPLNEKLLKTQTGSVSKSKWEPDWLCVMIAKMGTRLAYCVMNWTGLCHDNQNENQTVIFIHDNPGIAENQTGFKSWSKELFL